MMMLAAPMIAAWLKTKPKSAPVVWGLLGFLPFVLGPLRNTGAGQRLFVGVLVGLAFYVINEVSANSGHLYGWNPLVAAGAPTLALAVIGLWRLSRVR